MNLPKGGVGDLTPFGPHGLRSLRSLVLGPALAALAWPMACARCARLAQNTFSQKREQAGEEKQSRLRLMLAPSASESALPLRLMLVPSAARRPSATDIISISLGGRAVWQPIPDSSAALGERSRSVNVSGLTRGGRGSRPKMYYAVRPPSALCPLSSACCD